MRRTMLTGLAALAALATSASADNHLAPEPDPAAEAGAFEITIDPDRYERMTVPVTIGGSGPYRFLIDTGAQATVVTPKILTDLEMEPSGRATLVAMGSRRVVETVELDGLEFADRTLNNLTAPLLQTHHVGADGILGLDTLQDMRVLIDFREDRMLVTGAGEDGGTKGYEIVVRARRKLGQMIITNARIDGVRTAIIIDTGAQTSHGNSELKRRLRKRQRETLLTKDVNGVIYESSMAFAGKLEMAGLTMSQIPIGFSDSPVFAQLGLEDRPALILGMQNLRSFERVAIDFASRRILFDLPAGSGVEHLKKQTFFPSRLGAP